MPILRRRIKHREDIVSMSMSEIILFFLFFCLILLGSLFHAQGLDDGKASARLDSGGLKLDELLEKIKFKDEQIAGLRIIIGDMRETSDRQAKDLYEIRIKLGNKEAEVNRKNATIAALRGKIEELDDANQALAKANADLSAENAAFQIKIGELTALILDLEEQIALLTKERDDALAALDLANRRIEELKGDNDGAADPLVVIAGKDEEIKALQIKLGDALAAGREKDAKIAEQNATIIILRGDNDKLTIGAKNAILDDEKTTIIINGLRQDLLAEKGKVKELRGTVDNAEKIVVILQDQVAVRNGTIRRLERERDKAVAELAQRPEHELDALVTLNDDAGYTFDKSISELSGDFKKAFEIGRNGKESGLAQVLRLLESADSKVIEAIEVIGHTDEQPYTSNEFDEYVLAYVNGQRSSLPKATNNVELGMLRAAAAAKYLREQLRKPKNKIPISFREKPIIPLSAGELVTTGGNITLGLTGGARDNKFRRRVEIRLRSKPTRN